MLNCNPERALCVDDHMTTSQVGKLTISQPGLDRLFSQATGLMPSRFKSMLVSMLSRSFGQLLSAGGTCQAEQLTSWQIRHQQSVPVVPFEFRPSYILKHAGSCCPAHLFLPDQFRGLSRLCRMRFETCMPSQVDNRYFISDPARHGHGQGQCVTFPALIMHRPSS